MARGSWRYVVSRVQYDGEDDLQLRELYTDADGGLSWTADPVHVSGESIAEVRDTLERMTAALQRPFLDLTMTPPELREPEELRR